MNRFEIHSFPDERSLAATVAERWICEATASDVSPAYFAALSGGRVARLFLAAIAEHCLNRAIRLERVHFFWGDERCVPPTDSESNFALARQNLFLPLNLKDSQIHRIPGELAPKDAVSQAEAEIRAGVPLDLEGQPVLDIVFLGMGEDGHVASLFPGEPEAIAAGKAIYRAVHAAKPPPARITLGYAAIRAARQVWVLASGSGKEEALANSLRPVGKTPLARVLQERQSTLIFTDLKTAPD